MADNNISRDKIYNFDSFIGRLDEFTSVYDQQTPSRLLSRRDSSAIANNGAQDQQSNISTVTSPTLQNSPSQGSTRAHLRRDKNDRFPASQSNSLLPHVAEPNRSNTSMTGIVNNNTAGDSIDNNDITTNGAYSPAAREEAIKAYLDSLPNIDPPNADSLKGKNIMGSKHIYGPPRDHGRHAMSLFLDEDEDEDMIPPSNSNHANLNTDDGSRHPISDVHRGGNDAGVRGKESEEETLLDCIMVTSEAGSEVASRNDSARPGSSATPGSSLDNSILISSDDSPEIQVIGVRQSNRGSDGNHRRHISISSSSSALSEVPTENVDAVMLDDETEVQDDEAEVLDNDHSQQLKEELVTPQLMPQPVALPEQQHQSENEEQKPKSYYFATGELMDRIKMRKRFPQAKYLCLAKLKGYRWLICGPRRCDPLTVGVNAASDPNDSSSSFAPIARDFANQNDVFSPSNKEPEGYATIAPVYKNKTGTNRKNGQELDLERSCVYGSLYEASEDVFQSINAWHMNWSEFTPFTVPVNLLVRDVASIIPEMAGTMPPVLRELEPICHACTYIVDGSRWHLPWRAPDWRSGGHMELGRLRDHERDAMVPYMQRYNADWPHARPPYMLPDFARLRRDNDPEPLSYDLQPRTYRGPYMDALRELFREMLFGRETPLWYVNEVLRPWANELEWWPEPHAKWELPNYARHYM
ncbi:hypothetical protein PG989_003121 [Apiospora arundinis]